MSSSAFRRPAASSGALRRPAALLAGSALLLLGLFGPVTAAGPAAAAPRPAVAHQDGGATASAGSSGSTEDSAGQKIADALRRSPVYVDPAYAGAVPAARQRELVRQIAATGLPIKVALVPLAKGDAFDGDPQVLAGVLHDRLAQRELILVTMDQFPDTLAGWEWPDDAHQAEHAVDAVGFLDDMKDAGLADRVAKAIQLIGQGDGDAVYDKATADLDGGSSPGPTAGGGTGSGPSAAVWVLVAVAAVLVAGGGGWLLRRRVAARRSAPFAFPRQVFAAEEAADEAALRQRAEAEVIALGETVEEAENRAGTDRALDAYAAAGAVLDAARGIPDLAGVLALVAEGRDALVGRADALPLCFFHPLHGRAVRRLAWRPLGRRDALDVAACAACAAAVAEHRSPEVLTDSAADGRRVPYFELPARESVWAATGYGSLVPRAAPSSRGRRGGSGDGAARAAAGGITERVLRGDFSRARRQE